MKNILIVDDEEKIRKMFSEYLQIEGYKTFEASNVMDANDILEEVKIDLILLDINMPVFNGKLLHDLKLAFFPETRIIVSSVYPVDEQKRMIPHVSGYYDKSKGIRELLKQIDFLFQNEKKAEAIS